jgi:hypothetical protein
MLLSVLSVCDVLLHFPGFLLFALLPPHRAEAVSGYYDDTSDYSIKGETNAVAVVVAPVVEQNLSFAMSTLLM